MRSFTPPFSHETNPDFVNAQVLLEQAATSTQEVFHMRSVGQVDPSEALLVCASLNTFSEAVSATDSVRDPAQLLEYGGYPIDRLAGNALRACAVSPIFELPERMELVRTWSRAFSSGPAPYMPTERFAIHSARSLLDDALKECHIQPSDIERAVEVKEELYRHPLGRMALLSVPRATLITARTAWRRRGANSIAEAA